MCIEFGGVLLPGDRTHPSLRGRIRRKQRRIRTLVIQRTPRHGGARRRIIFYGAQPLLACDFSLSPLESAAAFSEVTDCFNPIPSVARLGCGEESSGN